MNKIISASILNADFKNLENEIKRSDAAGCKWLHFDVMDGNFVPNISFGYHVLNCIKNVSNQVKDVHLMIKDPKTGKPTRIGHTIDKKGNKIRVAKKSNESLN